MTTRHRLLGEASKISIIYYWHCVTHPDPRVTYIVRPLRRGEYPITQDQGGRYLVLTTAGEPLHAECTLTEAVRSILLSHGAGTAALVH